MSMVTKAKPIVRAQGVSTSHMGTDCDCVRCLYPKTCFFTGSEHSRTRESAVLPQSQNVYAICAAFVQCLGRESEKLLFCYVLTALQDTGCYYSDVLQ